VIALKTTLPILILAIITTASPAQTPPAAAGGFGTAPLLKASEILQLPCLSSPFHTVREEATTHLGANRFVIDSPSGTFVASGNQMLQDRLMKGPLN